MAGRARAGRWAEGRGGPAAEPPGLARQARLEDVEKVLTTSLQYDHEVAEQKVGFAFTITEDGPSQGLTSGPWRVKVTKNDVYIYAKELGDKWKTSLHGDSAWRTAVTSETHRSDTPILPPDEDRAPWKYTPTEFKNGVRLAFVLACTRGLLATQPG